jgi:restriction endonuclease Mrr
MAKPSSQIIAGWVRTYLNDESWRPLKDVAFEACKQKMKGQNDSVLYDLVEENFDYIIEHLRDYVSNSQFHGETLLFEIDDETNPYVRSIHTEIHQITRKLRQISPDDFENLCGKILKSFGTNVQVTGSSHDEGIDFYCTDFSFLGSGFNVPEVTKATVIGQAKRYRHRHLVKVKELREFVGSAVHRLHTLRTSSVKPLSPVILAFWTSSAFNLDAKEFAQNLGLWYMNGWSFAEFINKLNLTTLLD